MVLDIELHQFDGAGLFLDHLFNDGAELFARAAPRRPKIHDNRDVAAGNNDIIGKFRRGTFFNGARIAREAPQ